MYTVITSKQDLQVDSIHPVLKEVLKTKILWRFNSREDAQHAATVLLHAGFEFVYMEV